jgi:hypothetical protein
MFKVSNVDEIEFNKVLALLPKIPDLTKHKVDIANHNTMVFYSTYSNYKTPLVCDSNTINEDSIV